jgi:nucleoside-diphosphate-sugar epimerase
LANKPSVLLTGASGLLGRELTPRLLDRFQVYALVRRPPETPSSGVSYLEVDFSKEWNPSTLPRHVDAIIHLAQSSRFREFPEEALDVFRVNVDSTARLLDYARMSGTKQFVYASSGGVYGTGTDAFSENSPLISPGKLGFYLGSKLCGEVLVQSYVPMMQALVLRFFFMYGPGQDRSMLIPRLVDSIRDGRPVILQGGDGIRINPIHVSDAATAVLAALNTTSSATYNIAGREVFSLRQVAETIGRLVGVEPVFEHQKEIPRDLIGAIGLMQKELHSATTHFAEGIKDLL